MEVSDSLRKRFWAKVERGVISSDCWKWNGATHEFGYGVIGIGTRGERLAKAHRLSWIIHNGPILDGMMVLHRCDNPPCCNPQHLWLGTNLDNVRDMRAKGRGANPPRNDTRGERHVNHKLTVEDVLEIRRLRGAGMTYRRLGEIFGVSQSVAWRIVKREKWSHV